MDKANKKSGADKAPQTVVVHEVTSQLRVGKSQLAVVATSCLLNGTKRKKINVRSDPA